jgi:heme O synthase-like polyprenyltransferase
MYFAGVTLASTVLVTFSIMTVARPSGRRNWIMYKFSAPYMVIVLLFAAIDRFLVA